ncbi:MAG: hypothetical protein IPJ15_16615 [Actinomycetales bacterium]|jgi:hypothetical protein|nr:hypothetical protein [Candidatus Phosphoribacter baldrii]MBK7612780.1 hypothetical protein [Candidatus Phosphoribacter baldrii]
MSRVRIYLPLTAAEVDVLLAGDSLRPATAYAVTVRLASVTPGADVEELEYAAFLDAAAAAGRARSGDIAARRVIAAADVDPGAVTELALPHERTPAEVALGAPVDLRAIASLHVDEEPGSDDDSDLLWFDATEALSVRQLLT